VIIKAIIIISAMDNWIGLLRENKKLSLLHGNTELLLRENKKLSLLHGNTELICCSRNIALFGKKM